MRFIVEITQEPSGRTNCNGLRNLLILDSGVLHGEAALHGLRKLVLMRFVLAAKSCADMHGATTWSVFGGWTNRVAAAGRDREKHLMDIVEIVGWVLAVVGVGGRCISRWQAARMLETLSEEFYQKFQCCAKRSSGAATLGERADPRSR